MTMNTRLWARASILALAVAAAPHLAAAQEDSGAVGALRDEILVTAQKKAAGEDVQDVPLAVTAYGAAQLDALKVRTLGNLRYAVPNVQLEDIGTSRGVANFSIRGLGINSSIPSIDPSVGVFVDQVYLGQNAGVVLDIFDLDSVEVLRGPQGILFGRNVTGGAVLINTKKPNLQEFEAAFKGSVDSGFRGTGLNYTAMGAVSVPIIEDTLAFRVTAFYNDDNGWQERYLGGPNLVARLNALGAAGGAARLLQNGIPIPTGLPSPPFPATVSRAGLLHPIAVNRPDAFENHGVAETWSIRPQLLWQISDGASLLVRYERFQSQGDGASAQNHPGFRPGFDTAAGVQVSPIPTTNAGFSTSRFGFDFSIDEPGYYETVVDSISAQLDIDVPFGDGTITNVFGWRSSEGETLGDIDATPYFLFHAGSNTEYDQISNEIRYAGRFFDRLNTTIGFYYFTSDTAYEERRFILGGFDRFVGGGIQDARNYGIFGQFEFDLTETLKLIGGARYTNEKKSVEIANIALNNFGTRTTAFMGGSLVPGYAFGEPTCSIFDGSCGVDFTDTDTWKNPTYKAGLQWQVRDWFQAYASWTEGVRSGGYNFRNTSVVVPIAGFDEEDVDTYEVGFKAQPGDGKATINVAVFKTDINNMQREVNLPDPTAGVVQLIRNTADATIFGIEMETRIFLTDNLVFTGNLGHLDGSYDSVLFNLNSDFRDLNTGLVAGVPNATVQNTNPLFPPLDPEIIDFRDELLQIPRLSPWTWGAGFVHTLDLGSLGTLDTRFNYAHRDDNAYTDNNLGILNGADIIDSAVSLNVGEHAIVSIYGQNLLNEATHGGETQLPTSLLGGGTFAPLNKGRVVGVELQLKL
jgi:iron complex outermembrane receptor protein